MARKKAEGVVLGRPTGRKSSRVKLSGREEEVMLLLESGVRISDIARKLDVHRNTVYKFMRERLTDLSN